MPELPDVETFKRYIEATSLHKKIAGVRVLDSRMLEAVSPARLRKTLEGRSFASTGRRGKHLFVQAGDRTWLVLHFGMSGGLDYGRRRARGRHDRLLIDFAGRYTLAYTSQRRLGKIALAESPEAYARKKSLGPDALEISCEEFSSRIRGSRAAVKSSLMNQRLVAGVGNVYSDEILFQGRVAPTLRGDRLGDKKARRLCRVMRRVLETAVERKADPGRFPRTWLLPRRGTDRPCPGCGGPMRGTRVSGRSATWCPSCQRR